MERHGRGYEDKTYRELLTDWAKEFDLLHGQITDFLKSGWKPAKGKKPLKPNFIASQVTGIIGPCLKRRKAK